MTIEEKKKIVLKELYKYKFDGRYYVIVDILEKFVQVGYNEAFSIGEALENQGFIKFVASKQGASAEITSDGVEYVESYLLDNINYSPSDLFTEGEKKFVLEKLEEFTQRLDRLELGQQVIYDDLKEDMEVLKALVNTLGKKDWSQLLKGKLVDAGLGKIVSNALEIFVDTFKNNLLPN